ncbi:MAG: hypothetical protein HYV95_03005 [Opitutae bacterium]|nr:hypothetical protein [Opitutae bacterium]
MAFAGPKENTPYLATVVAGVDIHRHQVLLGGLRRRLVLLCLLAMAAVGVQLVYALHVSPRYDYMGFHYYGLGLVRGLAVVFWLAVPVLFLMPGGISRPSHLGLWVLFLGAYFPGCLIPALSWKAGSGVPTATAMVLAVGLLSLVLTLRMKLPPLQIPQFRLPRWKFTAIALIVGLLPAMLLFKATGSFELDFGGHYDRRMAAREITRMWPQLAYASEWLGSFFVPFLAGLAVRQRSVSLAAAAGFGVVVLFAFDGTKSSVFLLVAAAAVAWSVHHPSWLQPQRLMQMFLAFVAVALIEPLWFDKIYLIDYVLRRIVIIPGLVAGFYVDFFSQNPLLFMSDVSGFQFLAAHPYGIHHSFLIGERYLGDPELNANCGLWPTAYAELHLPGVILFSVVAGLGLRFFDQLWLRRGDTMQFVAAAVTALIWVEIPLHSSLTSAGVAFWFVLPMIVLKRTCSPGPEHSAGYRRV